MIQELLWNKIQKQLDKMMQNQYDEKAGLFGYEAKGINYHSGVSGGMVHSTRDNLGCMPAFLKRGTEKDRELALSVIPKVLALQDRDENSLTYGIWPYLFEEPLTEMKNPDWNWGPFLGASLITLLEEFREVFPDALVEQMEAALVRVCESIRRRNLGVDYTNISLMSGFVMTLTGELLENDSFYRQGVEILQAQLSFVEQNGGYAEYNSPTYGVIDIEETGRILRYTRREEVRRTAYQLHRMAWKVFAEHYHSSTGQIAPPHARCYADIQDSLVRTLITVGTNGACELEPYDTWLAGMGWPFLVLECPGEFWGYFQDRDRKGVLEDEFYKGIDPASDDQTRVLVDKGTPALTAYTFFQPEYCLGSFREHDMWNQRRPLMAYFDTEEGVACFRVRCMHDDMDFAGAILRTCQQEGAAVGAVRFVTDHGDYHYILTPVIDGKIRADRFSLDFVLEGALAGTKVTALGRDGQDGAESFLFETGGCRLYLKILGAVFGREQVRTELIDTDSAKGVRLVLFEGKNRELDLAHLEKAYAAFWLEITGGWEPATKGRLKEGGEKCFCILENQDGKEQEIEVIQEPGFYGKRFDGMVKEFGYGGFRYRRVEGEEKR